MPTIKLYYKYNYTKNYNERIHFNLFDKLYFYNRVDILNSHF